MHLPLGARKAFALRVLMLEVHNICAAQIDGWDDFERWPRAESNAWQRFVMNVERTATEQLPPDDRDQNNQPLDDLIRETVGRYAPLDDATTAYLGPAVRQARALAAAPGSRREAVDCGACACEANKHNPGLIPCRGRFKNDSELVTLVGSCIAPIRTAFSEALALAQKLYGRATGLSELDAALVTELGVPERLRGELIATTGRLRWVDRPGRLAVVVEVTVNVREFDGRGLSLLPHCLAHEFVCHAFQEAAARQPRSGGPDGYDPLAEGWMDYLLTESFERSERHWTGSDIVETSGWIHKLRRDKSAHLKRFPYAGQVYAGAKAAEAVLDLFELQGTPSGALHNAWDDFVDISCQLNAHPWPAKERNNVMQTIPRRLGKQAYHTSPTQEEHGTADVEKDLCDALCRWRTTRSGRPWLDAITEVIAAFNAKKA